jgi:predicted nucleic acid-binding protein
VTSKPGRKNIERVAADSNVILSAVIGKAALRVFTQSTRDVVITEGVLEEVREYIPYMAELYGLAPEVLESQLRLLAIHEYPLKEYKRYVAEAERRIGDRDPDDIGLLALSLATKTPIWSDDNDFKNCGVEWYTTARLLKILGI